MRIRPLQTNKRWFRVSTALLLGLFIILLMWIDFVNYKWRKEMEKETESEENFALLQSKLHFIAMDYERKEAELMALRSLKANEQYGGGSSKPFMDDEQNVYFSLVTGIMQNLSNGFPFLEPVQHPLPLDAELTVTTMRHLRLHPCARCPAFQVLSPRSSAELDVVIGIPTVQRDKENYLIETIESLIKGMSQLELTRTLIVVSIGEAENIPFLAETALNLNKAFPDYYGDLIEVVSPHRRWYPSWKSIRESLGDSYKRTVWRTKQNLDAIFLMSYAQSRASYYLMLEDDVIAKEGFMTEMMKFTAAQTVVNPSWFFINFSSVGGIGKLFRSLDLAAFNSYVQVFYPFMPIDWLTETYLAGRVCGLNVGSDQCSVLKKTIRPIYKKALFEHAGLYSSLRGKLHKVKKSLRGSKPTALFFPHWNPAAKVISTVKAVDSHSIARAYRGLDYFSGQPPRANDTIAVWFEPPLEVDTFYIGTGSPAQASNTLQNSIVEVLPAGETSFQYVEKFDEFGICEGHLGDLKPLSAIRIRILSNMKQPIMINEIKIQPKTESRAIFIPKNEETTEEKTNTNEKEAKYTKKFKSESTKAREMSVSFATNPK